jgi:hypothetical protein
MKKINNLFDLLWNEYTKVNPETKEILDHFKKRENSLIHNDHIALRTLQSDKIGIDQLAKPFLDLGYVKKDFYTFKDKKLNAYYFTHPDSNYPKVFISELRVNELSDIAKGIARDMIKKSPEKINGSSLVSGTHWDKEYKIYKKLYKESEYLAWIYAYGFIPNHFTVSVNKLKTFKSLQAVNKWLKSLGYKLNNSGGEIKGSPQENLEQSSTMATKCLVNFLDGQYLIPSCYYEFALRYKNYEGFIANSADKIFESTNE